MQLKGRKILITGGAGFIGSHTCKRLLQEGATVLIFDNFETGKMENLQEVSDDISIIRGDIRNLDEITEATYGCDLVLHEAFPYGVATRAVDKQYTSHGGLGTFNVLRAALENGVQKVVYASTVAVYGIQQYLPLDEDHPKEPFLPYGATKYIGELYCSTFAKVYGLDTISLRYFNVYGPRYAAFDHSAVILFLQKAARDEDLIIYGDGNQVRDYTYIDDVVEANILALRKENSNGAVYNIGEGRGLKIGEAAQKIVAFTESKSQVRFANAEEYKFTAKGLPNGITKKTDRGFLDERNYIADITKARDELGYEPKTPLEEGIVETFKWVKAVS